jgi:hypothetical protein
MKRCALIVLFSASFYSLFAQFRVAGTVADSLSNAPLIGVGVILRQARDTTRILGAISDENGNFEINNVRPGGYLLRLTYTGYASRQERLFVRSADVNLGPLQLAPSVITLKSVVIHGDPIAVEQKQDTVLYQANAYKTNPDASAEDLITKMPGITVDGTGIKAQGENVNQILVDGKRFFGDDPNIALRNLPAEIIDKVEVFDQLSEQSQFTGFDDGQTQKTINIVTKRGMRTGQFGKVNAGIGEKGHYTAGGTLNAFERDRKLTVLGLSNNINQQNFGTDDLLGLTGGGNGGGRGGAAGGGRGPGQGGAAGAFLLGQQSGISKTHSAGLNYINQWGKKIELSGSYFFNTSDNDRITNLSRNYISRDTGMIYYEKNNSNSENTNHRVNFRLKYDIDSANSLVITPRLSMQLNNSTAFTGSFSTVADRTVNTLDKTNSADNAGINFSNNVLFRHRFAKRGRSLSLGVNIGVNDREGESELHSSNENFDPGQFTRIDQRSDQLTNNHSLSSNVAFTEPVGKYGQLQLNYTAALTKSDSDKKTYDGDPETGVYSELNPDLSNVFKNTYISNRGGVSYRYNVIRKYNVMAGFDFQNATLSSDQNFPRMMEVERSFRSILPQLSFNYRLSQGENFRVMYRTNTNAPSISQLQNVVNNTNPLFLRSGNTDLKQDYQQTLTLRYGKTSIEKGRTFLLFVNGSFIEDYIGNATFYNGGQDSMVVNEIKLAPGQQLTYPVNVPQNWNTRAFVTYGLPLKFLKSNLNLNTGFNYNRSPARINDATNLAHNYAFSQGVILSSNISETVDFTFSYSANYTVVKNTLTNNQEADNNYFTHLSSFRVVCQPWKGLVFNSNLTSSFYNGLSSEFDQSIWLWNASIGYKLLKDKSLEIKVNAFDLLNKNKSINREVTDTFIEDSQTNVLTRYFMLTAIYSFRKF